MKHSCCQEFVFKREVNISHCVDFSFLLFFLLVFLSFLFFWSFYPFFSFILSFHSLLIFCQSDLKKMQIMMMVNAYFFPLFLNLLTLIFGQAVSSIQETTTNAAVKQGTEKPTFFVLFFFKNLS